MFCYFFSKSTMFSCNMLFYANKLINFAVTSARICAMKETTKQ